MCWKIIFANQSVCPLAYFLLCNLHLQLPFIDKKFYFQSWSDLRLHFIQKCVASNFTLLSQRPFCSSVLQSLPIESLDVLLKSNMILLLLLFVRCTDRTDDQFAFVLLLLLFFFKFYFELSCWFCVCHPFAFCYFDNFCLHILTCACPNWRTLSFWITICNQEFLSLCSLQNSNPRIFKWTTSVELGSKIICFL